MQIIGYVLAALLGLAGLAEILWFSQTRSWLQLFFGAVLLGAAGAIVWLLRMKPPSQTHVHQMQVDLTGDVRLEHISCKQCGAELSSKSVKVAAGAVFVHCEYCGSEYQLEEEPKW